ncbi:MAG: hypothetical protein U0T83_06970 [Bacteriovoracaceae bacterium]
MIGLLVVKQSQIPVLIIASSNSNLIYNSSMVADKNNPLLKQLEEQRFEHALSYADDSSHNLKKLTSQELVHINQLLTKQESVLRLSNAEIQLKNGKIQSFSMISNPLIRARDVIADARDIAFTGDLGEAVFHLYTQLILDHLFNDANRRTAAVAAYWLMGEKHIKIDVYTLLEIPVGDLRDLKTLKELRQDIEVLVKQA